MTAAIPPGFMPYGAPELKGAARPHMAHALLLSSALGFVAFALSWWVNVTLPPHTRPLHDPNRQIIDVPHPPPLVVPRVEDPEVPIAPPSSAKAAIPVPVPETQATPEATIPSQDELDSSNRVRIDAGNGVGEKPSSESDQVVNDRGKVALVDELPEPVSIIKAEYPELARQAGVEGLVVVDMLVGKDGRVLDALVDPKHSVPLLDGAAVAAARQWVFKPALTNNRAVKVWVAVRFHFKLH